MAAPLPDRRIHGVVEDRAAVGIGVAGSIVCMGAIEDAVAVHGQRKACRRGEEQSIAERDIGGDRLAVRLLQLLRIGFVDDLLLGALQQRALAVLENFREIIAIEVHMVVIRHRLGRLHFLLVFLPVQN